MWILDEQDEILFWFILFLPLLLLIGGLFSLFEFLVSIILPVCAIFFAASVSITIIAIIRNKYSYPVLLVLANALLTSQLLAMMYFGLMDIYHLGSEILRLILLVIWILYIIVNIVVSYYLMLSMAFRKDLKSDKSISISSIIAGAIGWGVIFALKIFF